MTGRVWPTLLATLALLLPGPVSGPGAARPAPAPQVDWLADFADLQSGLARNYANFEFALTDRRMNLPAIAERYRGQIAAALDDAARRTLFDRFVAEFRDPHVRIDWTSAGEADSPACAVVLPEAGIAWQRSSRFVPLPGDEAATFGAGLIAGTSTRDAVVRLPSFDPRSYPQCRIAARTLRIDPLAPCNAACAARLDRAAGTLLSADLATVLRDAARHGARRIVIDLVDNEGGTDWVESALRIVAGPVPSPRVGMLRHPAWTRYLTRLVAALPRSDVAERRTIARLVAAGAAIDRPCDLSAAWRDADLAMGLTPLPCSTIVRGVLFSGGPDARAMPGSTPLTFAAARYGRSSRATALPVVVLVNDNSHSAAELFAAAVQDARAGRVAGVVTPGAACGTFTDQGSAFRLPRSGGLVQVPDCVRLRADGSNERRGIVPDVPVPWGSGDSGWMRLTKVEEVLRRMRD